MDSIGLFEAAVSGEDEQRIAKHAYADKIAAATYDVRERHGQWLFGAADIDGFNDRAKLAFVSICQTIEPHMHARTGVYRRVMKAMEKEWRERQACYPGCDENEAHAKKFHKDKAEDKEARRRQAADGYPDNVRGTGLTGPTNSGDFSHEFKNPQGADIERPQDGPPRHQKPSVQEDPDRAHRILDRAHELVDERNQGSPTQYGNGEPRNTHAPGYDPNLDTGWQDGGQGGPSGADALYSPEELDRHNQMATGIFDALDPRTRNRGAARYAEFETEHNHPELHTQETFQDHQGEELIPEGNFGAYKDRVDQGAPSKVDHDFIDGGGQVRQHDESGADNFIPRVTGSRYPEYEHIARMVRATGDPSASPAGAGGDMGGGAGPGAGMGAPPAADPGAAMAAPAPAAPAMPAAPPMTPTASREYDLIRQMVAAPVGPEPLPATPGAPTPGAGGSGGITPIEMPSVGATGAPPVGGAALDATTPPPMTPTASLSEYQIISAMAKGSSWASRAIQESGTRQARQRLLEVANNAGLVSPVDYRRIAGLLSRRVADRNYLQQADEAITKVLNEKAEEFQNTIAPLQQALITIQQAEQLANPLNVSPPAGTVNVMPGGQAPQGQGGLGADPAAAGLAAGAGGAAPPAPAPDPTQQMQARRKRGGSPKGEARQAGHPEPSGKRHRADVVQDFNKWVTKNPGLPTGGEADIDQFAQQKKKGPRSITKLKHQQGVDFNGAPSAAPAPPKAPAGPASSPGGASNYGIKATTRRKRAQRPLIAEPDYVWSKSPSTVHVEFANRMGSGAKPDDVFRQMIAEITDHHGKGHIDNRDAHRAANEVFGRLLFSRRQQAANGSRGPMEVHPHLTNNGLLSDEDLLNQVGSGLHDPHGEWVGAGDHEARKGRRRATRNPGPVRKQAWSGWGPDITPKRHHVADWEWDNHLNGFVSTAARQFECSCGAPVNVPDYHNCHCGKIWNTYVIGTGGDRHQAAAEKFLAREVPNRDNVLVASRKRSDGPRTSAGYGELSSAFDDAQEGENAFPSDHHPATPQGKSTPEDWHHRDVDMRWTS